MLDLHDLEKYKENNRIEAKKAAGGFPTSIWETYSAFANTLGGYILLGVEELEDHRLHAAGLPQPELTVKELWDTLNDPERVSVNILCETDVMIQAVDNVAIVVVRVPEAEPQTRPVYVGGNIMTGSYRRSGEGDHHCTAEEIADMLRAQEAAKESAAAESPKYGGVLFPAAMNKPTQADAVIQYLTENVACSASEIGALLGVREARAKEILRKLIKRNVVVAEGENQSRTYKLKG